MISEKRHILRFVFSFDAATSFVGEFKFPRDTRVELLWGILSMESADQQMIIKRGRGANFHSSFSQIVRESKFDDDDDDDDDECYNND